MWPWSVAFTRVSDWNLQLLFLLIKIEKVLLLAP